jgi:hypothetical protein
MPHTAVGLGREKRAKEHRPNAACGRNLPTPSVTDTRSESLEGACSGPCHGAHTHTAPIKSDHLTPLEIDVPLLLALYCTAWPPAMFGLQASISDCKTGVCILFWRALHCRLHFNTSRSPNIKYPQPIDDSIKFRGSFRDECLSRTAAPP